MISSNTNRERSPQQLPSQGKMTILKRINSNRGKDRYYTRGGGNCSNHANMTTIQNQRMAQELALLEDEDDYEQIANMGEGTINI